MGTMSFDPVHDWPREGTRAERDAALRAAGYDPTASPRGVTGDPAEIYVTFDGLRLRNHVCQIDGLEIDGHGGLRPRSRIDRLPLLRVPGQQPLGARSTAPAPTMRGRKPAVSPG